MFKALALGTCGLAAVASGASTRGTKGRARSAEAEAAGLTEREAGMVQALGVRIRMVMARAA